jgi:hypothetical protein
MSAGLFIGVAAAVLFYRAADHERLNPMIWSAASLGVTGIVVLRAGGLGALLLGQVALFLVLWWYNVKRKGLA